MAQQTARQTDATAVASQAGLNVGGVDETPARHERCRAIHVGREASGGRCVQVSGASEERREARAESYRDIELEVQASACREA